jgi:hypothetical protein
MFVMLQTFPLLLQHDMKKTHPCEKDFAKEKFIRKHKPH